MQDQPINPGALPPTSSAPRKKITVTSWLFIGMVLLAVVIVICAGVWVYLSTKASSDNGKTQLAAYQLLEPKNNQPVTRTIESTLGVAVPYNTTLLAGFGFADVITYSSTDLDQARPYTVIRVRPIETSEAIRNAITVDSPELRITTSLEKNFWQTLQGDKQYKDLSKVDALVKKTVDERVSDKRVQAATAQSVTLGDNNVQYKKVSFTTKDENDAVPTVSREDCYITVQNDRPYVACINNIRPSNFAATPQLEQVVAGLSYAQPDTSTLIDSQSKEESAAMYDGTNDEKIEAPKKQSSEAKPSAKATADQPKIPAYLEHSADFAAVAKAEPATLRVGTIYCADITLSLPDNTAGTHLTGACVDKASSGFFVSKDGLIAALANKVKVTPRQAVQAYLSNTSDDAQTYDRLNRVLDYLQKSRIIMQSDADELVAGLQQRDRDAIDKINSLAQLISPEDITIDKEVYKYAVQLSDKPIVVNHSESDSLDFAYTDTVFEATLEGADYDDSKTPLQLFSGSTPDKDMALLRIKKQATYPTLQLAETSSLGNGVPIDIVGLPMYAFGTLEGGQLWSTPLVRQGKTDQSFTLSAGQRLQSITTPSHAGLSGAPALNQAGKVVGMATYDEASCPDNKCFASMVLRDPAPLMGIAKQRNLSLQTISAVSDTWNRAIDEYIRGNYKTATELFNQSSQLYPQNYLASQFAALAQSQEGSATDTSTVNSVITLLKVLILIALILLVFLIIVRLFIKVFSRPHYTTQYGQLAGGQYIDAKQWNPGGGSSLPPQLGVQQPPQPLAQFQPGGMPPAGYNQTPGAVIPPQGITPPPAQPSGQQIPPVAPPQYPPTPPSNETLPPQPPLQ